MKSVFAKKYLEFIYCYMAVEGLTVSNINVFVIERVCVNILEREGLSVTVTPAANALF